MSDRITRRDKLAAATLVAITLIVAAVSAYYLGALMRSIMG